MYFQTTIFSFQIIFHAFSHTFLSTRIFTNVCKQQFLIFKHMYQTSPKYLLKKKRFTSLFYFSFSFSFENKKRELHATDIKQIKTYGTFWYENDFFFFFKLKKNWKLLFANICENTCGWKSVWKYVKCCLKNKNCCLKIQTKHSLCVFKKDFVLTYIYIYIYTHTHTHHIQSNVTLHIPLFKSLSSRLGVLQKQSNHSNGPFHITNFNSL